jgi:hypothetical protein
MGRTPASAEDTALRHKGYETYSELGESGLPPTLKSVAATLGVSVPRVNYWFKTDRWRERLNQARVLKAVGEQPSEDEIKALLRRDLARHIATLSGIIEGTANDKTRVQAIVEYAKLAKQLGALDLVAPGRPNPKDLAFEDNLESPERM